MPVRDNLKKTGQPGVFYKDHKTRKHGIKRDRQYIIRQTLGGKTRISVLGWTSQGITLGDALNKAQEFKNNFKWNKLHPDQPKKPVCVTEELHLAEKQEDNNYFFSDLVTRFIKNHVEKKLAASTAREYKRQINNCLLPAWGKLKIPDIQRKRIVELVENISSTAPVQGNRTLATIKKMFAYGVDVGMTETNPAAGIKPPGGRETPRTRVLDLPEVATLFNFLQSITDRDLRDILKLITLTAQRPGEIAGMKLSQLKKYDDGLWFEMQPEDVKNREPQRIYLNDLAARIIEDRVKDMNPTNYIFPADTESGYMRKDVLAGKVRKIQPATQKLGVDYFTAHDLRRSAATGLARLGFGSIIDDILNHKQQGITRRVYDLYDRAPEIKRALIAWETAIKKALTY